MMFNSHIYASMSEGEKFPRVGFEGSLEECAVLISCLMDILADDLGVDFIELSNFVHELHRIVTEKNIDYETEDSKLAQYVLESMLRNLNN